MRTRAITIAPVPAKGKEAQALPPPKCVEYVPLSQITEDIARPLEARPGKGWWACFAFAFAGLMLFGLAVSRTFMKGIGLWGLNNSVGWAFDITNFVFWVGIGHAGTLISAILLLVRQQWRTSINRSAEAMTIFAVLCAALFPAIHMGRPWNAFFIFPYPNLRGPLWVNFRSPLVWDVFAINSGFGMVLMLLILTRRTMHLERYITVRHLDRMAKITLLTGSLVGYSYASEFFSAWYTGNVYERFHFINRASGPYAWCFYLM